MALLTTLFACGLLTGAASAAVPGETIGVYAGAGNHDGVAEFASRLGRDIDRRHDYLDKSSWAGLLELDWITDNWAQAGFADRLVLTVPMLPDDGGTLAEGAAGDFNAHYRTLAEKLVAIGHPSVVLRLGPEFNGGWFAWTINVPDSGALYAAYWRQIVTTMRSVPSADFTFDWCPNGGSAWIGGGMQLKTADAGPATPTSTTSAWTSSTRAGRPTTATPSHAGTSTSASQTA